MHQRGHSQCVAHVIRECQERAGVGNESAVQRKAIGDCLHSKLADAEVDVVAGITPCDRHAAGPVREHRAGQIGRAADHLGQMGGVRCNRLLRCLAGRDSFVFLVLRGDECGDDDVEIVGQLARRTSLKFGSERRLRRAVRCETGLPFAPQARTALARIEAGVDVSRNRERRLRPAQRNACRSDLILAESGAVCVRRSRLAWRALRDHRLAANQ